MCSFCFNPQPKENFMSIQCPQCASTRIKTRDIGRQTGGATGAVAGGWVGVTSAVASARLGALAGQIAGPVGSALGSIVGVLICGLLSATSVGLAGAQLGEIIDEHVLHNHECLDCGHVFSATP